MGVPRSPPSGPVSVDEGTGINPSISSTPRAWRHDPHQAPFAFGYHGDTLREVFPHVAFMPTSSPLVQRDMWRIVRRRIQSQPVPPSHHPVRIFVGNISMDPTRQDRKDTFFALATLAEMADVVLYDVRPVLDGAKRWVELVVAGEEARERLLLTSKCSVVCDDGGHWIATSPTGERYLATYKLTTPPRHHQGVPMWPVVVEPLKKRQGASRRR